jgi:hypothetical protein
MAITGPKIQVPTSLTPIMDNQGNVHPVWQSYFHAMQQVTFNVTRSGPTASRPTAKLDGRYIGMPYFDTTLGYQVWLKTATMYSSSDVWVNSAGAPV